MLSGADYAGVIPTGACQALGKRSTKNQREGGGRRSIWMLVPLWYAPGMKTLAGAKNCRKRQTKPNQFDPLGASPESLLKNNNSPRSRLASHLLSRWLRLCLLVWQKPNSVPEHDPRLKYGAPPPAGARAVLLLRILLSCSRAGWAGHRSHPHWPEQARGHRDRWCRA